ncbi:MAG: hypothetical protein B6U97_01885 [Candidatus Altiarchaeales archaeon ex4484_96]|nr:MAG: hypothetical protein B6U97_01885 [Candidatus Altiarchaeales archaeon ex4484_96]
MKTKKVLLGMVFLSLICNVVYSENYEPTKVVLNYELSEVEGRVYPGDKGIMNLVIENIGELNAERVEVQIPGAGAIRVAKKWYIGTLAAGDSYGFSTTFTVGINASVGTHTIPVYISYDGFDKEGRPDNNKRVNYEYNIKVEGNTLFVIESIQTSELKPEPGDTLTVSLGLRNDGIANAKNTEVMLFPPSMDLSTMALASSELLQQASTSINPIEGINVLGGEKQFIGDLSPGETKQVDFIIHLDDDLKPKAYSVPFLVGYEDNSRQTLGEVLFAGILISGETGINAVISETDPDEIHAGDKDVKITLEVDNTGTESLKNVKLTFEPGYPFKNSKSYVQTKDLGTLKSSNKDQTTFYANVDEDAKPTISEQVFNVEYEIDNTIQSHSFRIPIEVLEYPHLEVETSTVNATISMLNEMRLVVVNTGSKCESVTVWALKKSEQPFDFEDKSQFIGDLDEGESGKAVLGYSVEAGAKINEYILPLEIRCTRDDDVLTFTDTVRINVADGQQAFMDLCMIAGVIILFLVSSIIYITRFKGRGE